MVQNSLGMGLQKENLLKEEGSICAEAARLRMEWGSAEDYVVVVAGGQSFVEETIRDVCLGANIDSYQTFGDDGWGNTCRACCKPSKFFEGLTEPERAV